MNDTTEWQIIQNVDGLGLKAGDQIEWVVTDGRRATYVIKRPVSAAPKVELPTEEPETLWLDATGTVWKVRRDGKYIVRIRDQYVALNDVIEIREVAPFTRLEPVPVTAKKVLDRMQSLLLSGALFKTDELVAILAAEFGVPNE